MPASRPPNDAPLRDALTRLFDGELDDDGFAELARRLRDDPAARELYFEAAALEVNLEQVFAPPLVRGAAADTRQKAATRRLAQRSLGIAAAVALLIAGVMTFFQVRSEPAPAGLRLCANSKWTIDGRPQAATTGLRLGAVLVIDQGVAELELPRDTRAVVEAPAVVRLIDEQTLGLDRGRAFFRVESAKGRGFTVVTPHQRIVDLGTAFGVEAGPVRGEVALHVFEGRVRVDAPDGARGETIDAPRAVRLAGASVTGELETADSFLRELPSKVEIVFEDGFETGLAPGKEYAVIMDPRAILDLDGNPFGGIDDPKAWNFTTGDPFPVRLPVRNPGFEEDGEVRNHGAAVSGWHPAADNAWGWGADEQRGGLSPTDGRFFGRVFGGSTLTQDLGVPIEAGTTYALRVDVGGPKSTAALRFFGSDAGAGEPLAETTVKTAHAGWRRDRMLIFHAEERHATGQTLGVSLGRAAGKFAAFDRVRAGTSGPTAGDTLPDDFADLPELPDEEDPATSAPVAVRFHPADGATDAVPGESLAMAFSKPVRFGSGRIFVRNITDWRESELIVGTPRTSIEGRVLTLRPPLDLADGRRVLGRVPGWDCDAWAGVLNPAGDGTWYRDTDLRNRGDDRTGGVIGSMRGPILATFADARPGTGIRREIGVIEPDSRYSLRVVIGVRAAAADPAVFDGYTLRLVSGPTVLAELRDDAPPGPPNRVTDVSLVWDAAEPPEGIAIGDPLAVEIAPNQASGDRPGYLDLEHVRVTRLPQ